MKKNSSLIRSYIGFFISGFFVLSIGAIMPDLRINLNLSYTSVGTILSMFALGNLLSNFIFPIISDKMGTKIASITVIFMIPLGFILIVLLNNYIRDILWLIFLIMGIGRGSISIVSNTVTNDLSENKQRSMNVLHTIWAIGAFVSSFIIVGLKRIGFNFNNIMVFMIVATGIMWSMYATIDYEYEKIPVKKGQESNKDLDFYFCTIAFVMFFYVGVENTINGWFMTYLQDMEIISESIAAFIVSFTWLMIMLGRMLTAYMSKKIPGTKMVFIYTIGAAIMVFSLLLSKNATLVTISVLALGFFLSGIYPTSISNVSSYVTGNQKKLAILLTSAAIGGMITPQLIGVIADRVGMMVAINLLSVNVIAMVIFAFIAYKKDVN